LDHLTNFPATFDWGQCRRSGVDGFSS